MTALGTVIGRGVLASRPAASIAGALYEATDTSLVYRDNGSSWDTFGSVGIVDPTTTRGDLISRGAAALQRLALGAAGKVVASDGTDAVYAYPPGYEFDYVAITAGVTVTATTEGGATTIITGSAVTYDGATIILIEFFAPNISASSGAGNTVYVILYDGSSSIGFMGLSMNQAASATAYTTPRMARRLTPSNASHTYSIRAYKSSGFTGSVGAGAGGSGNDVPAFIRITKV